MLVVLIVPFAFNAMNVHGLDPYTPLAKTFSWTGFVVLVAITAGCGGGDGAVQVARTAG